MKLKKKLNDSIIQQLKDSENRNIVVYILGTLLSFHEKESNGWKNLHTTNTPVFGTPVLGAPSVTL